MPEDKLVELISAHTELVTVNNLTGCACGWQPENHRYVRGGHHEWCLHMAGVFRRYLNERPVIRKAPAEIGRIA